MSPDMAQARYPGSLCYCPGDSAALNAEVIALIRQGRKTMTCDTWENALADGMPLPGRIDIALDWEGQAAVATRTLQVEKIRFCDMDDAHVPPQAEFSDLDDWQCGYRAYLTRLGVFRDDIPLMVETFELVEDFNHV